MINVIYTNSLLSKFTLVGAFPSVAAAEEKYPVRDGQSEWHVLSKGPYLTQTLEVQEGLTPVEIHRKHLGEGILLILDYGP